MSTVASVWESFKTTFGALERSGPVTAGMLKEPLAKLNKEIQLELTALQLFPKHTGQRTAKINQWLDALAPLHDVCGQLQELDPGTPVSKDLIKAMLQESRGAKAVVQMEAAGLKINNKLINTLFMDGTGSIHLGKSVGMLAGVAVVAAAVVGYFALRNEKPNSKVASVTDEALIASLTQRQV